MLETARLLDGPHPRETLAANLKSLVTAHECETQAKFVQFARAAGVTLSGSSLSRTLNQAGAADIDLLAKLAVMFHVEPWRLLAPNLGGPSIATLEIAGRPMLPPITDDEFERRVPASKALRKANAAKRKKQKL